MIGQLGWQKIDLMRALIHFAAILLQSNSVSLRQTLCQFVVASDSAFPRTSSTQSLFSDEKFKSQISESADVWPLFLSFVKLPIVVFSVVIREELDHPDVVTLSVKC